MYMHMPGQQISVDSIIVTVLNCETNKVVSRIIITEALLELPPPICCYPFKFVKSTLVHRDRGIIESVSLSIEERVI